jgi:hypothetical protein
MPELVFYRQGEEPMKVVLERQREVFGSGADNDIVLPDLTGRGCRYQRWCPGLDGGRVAVGRSALVLDWPGLALSDAVPWC